MGSIHGDWKASTSLSVALEPKWHGMLLQFLHSSDAHTLSFNVRLQQGPQNFANTSAT